MTGFAFLERLTVPDDIEEQDIEELIELPFASIQVAFQKLCERQEIDDQLNLAFAAPKLLSKRALRALHAEIQARGEPELEMRSLKLLDQIRFQALKASRLYRLGVGPMERLLLQVANGALPMESAVATASKDKVRAVMSPVYAMAVSHWALDIAVTAEWQMGLNLGELLLAATGGPRVDDESAAAAAIVRDDFTQIGRMALCRALDGRVYGLARQAGHEYLKYAEESPKLGHVGDAHFVLGILHLDPFVSLSGAARGPLREQLGGERGVVGDQKYQEKYPLPTRAEAVARAIEHIQLSVPLREGRQRATALKALMQAQLMRAKYSQQAPDEKAFRQAAEEAIALFSESGDDALISEIHGYFATLKLAPPTHATHAARLPSEVFSGPGDFESSVHAGQALALASNLAATNPELALNELRKLGEPFAARGDEGLSQNRLDLMANIVAASRRCKEGSTQECASQTLELAKAESWSARQTGLELLGVAFGSGSRDEEELGLRVVDVAQRVDPTLNDDFADLLLAARRMLFHGSAVNATRQDRWSDAVRLYGQAVQASLAQKQKGSAIVSLAALTDAAGHPQPETALMVVAGLASAAIELDLHGGQEARRLLQLAYARAFGSFKGQTSVEIYWPLAHLSKGFTLSSAILSKAGGTWRDDPRAVSLLEMIGGLEKESATRGEVAVGDAELDEELLLTSYFESEAPNPGQDSEGLLVNLRHRFDEHAITALLGQHAAEPRLLMDADVRSFLDDGTVLVDLSFGQHRGRSAALYVMIATKGSVFACANELGEELVDRYVEQGYRQVGFHQHAPFVARLRTLLQRDPFPRAINAQAQQLLDASFEHLLGSPAWAELERLHAEGFRHLCVCPTGPLHFFPIHLLGKAGRDLAHEWVVTYLPSLALLSRQGAQRNVPRRPATLSAFGLDFAEAGPYELTPLPGAAKQADEVAAALGGSSFTNEAATEERFVDALQSSRYVHLISHGRHNIEAPTFQCVYLQPGASSDGRLRAHELHGKDLRGLELITFGACETALGRFDRLGSLSGLPAALLLAGAETIVGTLWDAETTAVQTFFTTFYRSLGAGGTRLASFRAAQLATRQAHPHVRDWAAFCLIGDWR